MFEPFNAIQIRVSIDDIAPPVWRRLIVPIHWNLEQLHLTIQAAFNWWNYHLHEFQIGGLRFGDAAAAYEGSCEDDPQVFEQLEAEASRMERPNRSLVVERALKLYFRIESQKQQGQTVIVLNEGVA